MHRPALARVTTAHALIGTAAIAVAVAACSGGTATPGPGTSDSAVEPPSVESTIAQTVETPATTTPTVVTIDEPIDWSNLDYPLECGAASSLDLVDGTYRPEQFNSTGESLIVEFRTAETIPGQDGVTLVHLNCLAGGPSAALSGELYAVMTERTEPPTMLASVVAEPGAIHTITDDGIVVIDDTTYGADDPNCCPSVFRSRQIVWNGDDPVVVEGARPDTPADGTASGGCIATEIDGSAAPEDITLLEQSLAGAGFDPGPVDGLHDQALMNAVVRFIEFNADNPALRRPEGAPYDNLHAEASTHGTVRAPVLSALGVACDSVAFLPRN